MGDGFLQVKWPNQQCQSTEGRGPEHRWRVITGTRESDWDLTHIVHDELHWLNVPQRVTFKLCELCVSVTDVAGSCQRHSASRRHLYLRRYNMTNYDLRALSYAGPNAWNFLPEDVQKLTPTAIFKRSLYSSRLSIQRTRDDSIFV